MFWHRLALALGFTVEDLQERMSSAEFTTWIAYADTEPFGYPMLNWRHAVGTASVVNAIRASTGTRSKPVPIETFLPQTKSKRNRLTPRQTEQLKRKRLRKKRHGNRRDS